MFLIKANKKIFFKKRPSLLWIKNCKQAGRNCRRNVCLYVATAEEMFDFTSQLQKKCLTLPGGDVLCHQRTADLLGSSDNQSSDRTLD